MEIITRAHDNDVTVLQVKGEVDAYTARDLDKALRDLLGQGDLRIVLDLSGMTFISSAGIRAILYAHREVLQVGGEVKLAGPTDQVRRVFEIVGFSDLLRISDRIEESIRDW